jgi:hypothetical protein
MWLSGKSKAVVNLWGSFNNYSTRRFKYNLCIDSAMWRQESGKAGGILLCS